MQVSEIMNPSVITIEPTESVSLAARLLTRHDVGSLPVCTEKGLLQGVVTDRDIIRRCVAAEDDPKGVPVGEIMTRYPAAIAPDDDIRQAAQLMAMQQIRRLPVVQEGKVVGVVSLGDLAKCGRYEMEVSKTLINISENVKRI